MTGNQTGLSVDALEVKKAKRFQFLSELYKRADGRAQSSVNQNELVAALGWTDQEADAVVEYLQGEGLLEYTSFGPNLGITHAGIREYERAVEHPSDKTRHFPPFMQVNNILHVGTMTQSQIQQGSTGSTLAVQFQAIDAESIRQAILDVRKELEQLKLSASQRAELEADLTTVDAQLKSPTPKKSVVRECLSSVRTILEQVGATLLASKLAALLSKMPVV